MSALTAGLTRLPGCLSVVILLAGLLIAPSPAAGAVGEPAQDGGWPLSPTPSVVHGFDPPSQPWLAGHRGVDLLGEVGQPVMAALPGIITFAGMLAGRGVVVIDHGGTRTTYEPVSATVAVGNLISAGEEMGFLDLAQSHCLPSACLHLGLIRNSDDVYLDPLTLFGQRPVRLLPLWREEPVTLARPHAGWEAPLQKLRSILERW